MSEIRKLIASAISDPGHTGEGYKGDRTLTEWQTDAVMRIVSELEKASVAYVDANTALINENKALRTKLFPYADATEISGISWDGKYLIGDKASISFFHEMKNRGEQIDVYKRAYDQNLAAKDAEIKAQAVVIEKYREAQQAEWHPISTCPVRDNVDLWCVYGGEEFAQFEGGSPIGFLVSNRFKTEEYGFFGNQSRDGVPRRDGPDFVPIAWRHAVPSCPPALIAEALGIPLTLEDALAKEKADV